MPLHPVSARSALSVALIAATLGGCSTSGNSIPTHEDMAMRRKEGEALAQGKPEALRPFYNRVALGGDRDRVRNWLELGAYAMRRGERAAAEEAFDEAIQGITTVYADDPAAERARSVWYDEDEKDFKGEPYERAMAFVYRGILDMLDGDYENARASFKGAMIQDSFAEQERFRQDFASAAWLSGWASHCLGAEPLAKESFAEAKSLNDALEAPKKGDDLLVIVDSGQGPRKFASGPYREILGYREGPHARAAAYAVTMGDTPRVMVEAEDLFRQAITRGGRQMDDVLAEKADTKGVTSGVGQVSTIAGLGVLQAGVQEDNRAATAVGLAFATGGLIVQALAQSMTAEADTRSWEGLPHSLFLASLPKTGSMDDLDVVFRESGTSALRDPNQREIGGTTGCGVVWYPSAAIRTRP